MIVDEEATRRERAESARLLADAHRVRQKAETVTDKLRRMADLYRERTEGVREPR